MNTMQPYRLFFLLTSLLNLNSVLANDTFPKVLARERSSIEQAENRLEKAIANPEYMVKNWIQLPSSPSEKNNKTQFLTLRNAILLALRYNPNIRNAELDRIIQRYQLRLANNEFELQYALAGTTSFDNNRYTGIGKTSHNNFMLTPEINLKTPLGGQTTIRMDNNVVTEGNYNRFINLSFKQPLLNGFGYDINQINLKNAIDHEWLNKLNLQQAVIDHITQLITIYRTLILSGNNLQNQRQQLNEARKLFKINQQRIKAGQLEPTANVQQSYQIESLSLMVEQAENDFQTTSQELMQSIGLDPDMKLAVPSDVELKQVFIPNTAECIEQALLHNTQYQALTLATRANKRAYILAKNQQLWQLDANAVIQTGMTTHLNPSYRTNDLQNNRSINESAGLTLRIPINDLNLRNQLITAKVQLEKDRLNLIAAKRALISRVKNIISNIASQAKRYELAKRQVELAAKSYALEKKKQQAGISSALDVNNTQNQLLQAQMGLIHAKIAYLNQLSALQQLLGTTLDHWKIKLRYH
ncbi:MAG: TolC family protein [Legionella sp.]